MSRRQECYGIKILETRTKLLPQSIRATRSTEQAGRRAGAGRSSHGGSNGLRSAGCSSYASVPGPIRLRQQFSLYTRFLTIDICAEAMMPMLAGAEQQNDSRFKIQDSRFKTSNNPEPSIPAGIQAKD